MHPQLQRCYDLAIRGAWHHPFFLIPLGHCNWAEGNPLLIKTMAIETKIVKEGNDRKPMINLYINTEWSKSLPDEEVFGVLCHEILHALLRHHERGGGKNQETWGQAADMAINASLTDSQIKIPRSGLLPPQDHWQESADELYTLLDSEQIPPPKGYDPDSVGQGCMPKKGNPNEDGEEGQSGDQEGEGDGNADGEGQGDGSGNGDGQGEGEGQGSGESGQSDSGADRAWGEMIAQAQSMGRGQGSAKALAKLFKPEPIKTKWEKLLQRVANRANANGGRDSQTFKRINRRSFDGDFTLPGWESKRPAVAVIIDSSGSVSDEMLRAALSSVKEIADFSGIRFFLALHDWVCYYADWIKPETTVESLSSRVTARGGTSPDQAFQKVSEAKGRFDACVYLTDGEVGQYPTKPLNVKRMIVGILGNRPDNYRATIPSGWQELNVEVPTGGDSDD
jgi:predicted metal-dependent peptidase